MPKNYLHLWRKTRTHRLKECPLAISIAILIFKGRYNLSSFEKAVYEIVKRDPEMKEILRYVTTGKPTLFKGSSDGED